MRGFLTIPHTMYVTGCSQCGARPVIALVKLAEYTVRCPVSDNHYHTEPGLIDLHDWNRHNETQYFGRPLPKFNHRHITLKNL